MQGMKYYLRKNNIHESIPCYIEEIVCEGLDELPEGLLSGCTLLKIFDCSYNRLSEIPTGLFEFCENLTEAFFQGNKLRKLPEDLFINNKQLNKFKCSSNEITFLPQKLFYSAVTNFDCNNNKIAALPSKLFDLSGKTLKLFECADNYLTSLPSFLFAKCIRLEGFFCSGNRLTYLPQDLFAHKKNRRISSLKSFHCADNRLTGLPQNLFIHNKSQGCTELKYINFNNNKIETLPPNLFACNDPFSYNLQDFYCDGNKLTSVPQNMFQNMSRLSRFSCSNNLIPSLLSLYSGLFSLRYLNCSGNNFEGDFAKKHLITIRRVQLVARCRQFVQKLKYRCRSRKELSRIAFIESINCRPPVLKRSDEGGIYFQESILAIEDLYKERIPQDIENILGDIYHDRF